MKKILVAVLILLVLFPQFSYAHMIGQPPYFKVDGVFTDYYPVPSTSIAEFELPQDIASKNFLVDEKIDFEIDTNALPVPKEIVESTKFTWDFGDGEKSEGLKNSHTYKNMGTYFLKIYAATDDGFEPQLLQSTALNIVPDENYKLPKAVIEVNKKRANDPLLDIIEEDFNKEIKFDASFSEKGSSEITEYFWDLGDLNSSKEKTLTYKYQENPYIVFAVLRIKTKDGFISDAFVQISEKPGVVSEIKNVVSNSLNWKILAGATSVALFLTGLIFWALKKFASR